jgi:hypothetical protein
LALKLRAWRPRLDSVQLHLLAPLVGTDLTAAHFDQLRYDGHVSGSTSVNCLTNWEEFEIRRQPVLFSSFYYCPNPSVARATYKWLYWAMTVPDRVGKHASGARLLAWVKRMGPFPLLGAPAGWTATRWAQNAGAGA